MGTYENYICPSNPLLSLENENWSTVYSKKRMKTNPTQTKLIQRPKNQMVTWPMAPTETIFLVQIKTHFYKSEIPSSYSKDRARSLVVMQHYPHLMTISQFLKTLN